MSSYTIEVILKASTSQFTAGMRQAMESVENFKSATTSLNSIGDAFMGVGSALTAGITAPVAAGVTAIIKSYADLEQAVGGVETLFKESAASVIANSETAYTRAGVSGVKYMEQVTSFSATLLQGLGGDTAKAAAYGDKAIVQMADNANKMGTAIGDIQNAYQGFAKDNYTMLDNLKLGYGGTQSEMARLVNESGVLNGAFEATAENVKDIPFHTLIEAIGITQDRLGITGTTAKEASETVSGSFQAMVAAGQNLVAGFGAADADVKTLMENLKSTVEIFVQNIKRVLKNIWDNLPMAEWQKWVLAIAVGSGPVLLAIGGIIKAVSGIGSVFKTVGAVMSNPFGLAVVAIAALVAGFIYAYNHSERFRNMVNSAVESVKNKFNELKTMAQPAIDSIVNSLKKLNVGAFGPLIGGVGVAILALKKLKGFEFSKLFKFPALPNPFAKLTGLAKSTGSAVKGVFSGLGKSISAVFKGIGSGIATAFRGIASSISMLNPVGVASFALGIAAVTAALIALSAVQGMVLPFLQGLSDILVNLVGGVLQAFATTLITLQPVMLTIATALSMLSPLIVAVGQAFAAAAPFVTALGEVVTNIVSIIAAALPSIITAVSGLVTAIAGGVTQIITAITPIVQIISDTFVQVVTVITNAIVSIVEALAPFIPNITSMFETIVTVVSQAIVQIVQALAPFIPELTAMVQAVAPVLEGIVSAFDNLISQISPIIDSITNLFKTLGEQISNILDSAKGVIEGFGSSVRNILDGIAGIFESMGNAAKNSGQGVKLMAQGIKMLVDLKLGDLVGTLAAVATGLTAIANSGIASAGPGLQQAGTGLRLIATSAQVASVAMQALPAAFSSLSSSVGTLPSAMTTAASAMMSFASAVVTSFAGLAESTASISALQGRLTALSASMMMAQAGAAAMSAGFSAVSAVIGVLGDILGTVPAGFTAITTSAMMARTSIMQLATSAPMVASGFASISSAATSAMTQLNSAVRSAMTQAVSTMRSSMTQMVSVVRQSASQMTQAGQQAGRGVSNGVTNGIRSGIGSATAAMSAMVNAIRSTAMAGAGAMQGVGAMIGQGLAQGMYSALGAVTEAANALVAQAERAARAKAQIHSPARLFRDRVGVFIGQGVAVGIDKSQKFVDRAMASMFDGIDDFNTQVGDLMAGNLAYSFDVGRHSRSVEVTYRRQDDEQMGVIREALATIKDLVSRDTVLEIDSREFARATGQSLSEYQNEQRQLQDMLRGIK
ncbi:tail tape measure protein [Streptococcus sp. 19428wC2_LYSM12]|uniref:tail tape measure protein n=1 Tax=unclassified Streptococcus TaxID=2608887 RepID=UPI0010720114|nr:MULTISPECIES: tail tape measure protein [unclassified Streptococcus]MBF0788181.1 tail tape measure protein [Streptococcus sp. 19428wC2_LYSM12]TFV04737.1 tail tape measure protein [Streptococcus sp. LYSM12]